MPAPPEPTSTHITLAPSPIQPTVFITFTRIGLTPTPTNIVYDPIDAMNFSQLRKIDEIRIPITTNMFGDYPNQFQLAFKNDWPQIINPSSGGVELADLSRLISGAALRIVWSFGGPEWSSWLGNLAFGIFFVVPGLTVLFAPRFAMFWMRSFGGSARGLNLSNCKQLGGLQRIVLYALALIDLLIGLLIVMTNLYRVLNGCTPKGGCPRL
jgi:hypothetical protein